MRLYVIAGHGAGDPGACGNGYTEAERVRALANAIKRRGGDSVVLLDTSRNWYADKGINSLNIPKGDCLVELHMDSSTSSARGGHVIIKAGIGGADAYDRAIRDFIVQYFPGRSVTIDERSDLANPNRAAARGINYRLVENGFISNAKDVATFNAHVNDLADCYLAAFGIKGSGSTASTDKPAASKPASKPAKKYSLKIDGVQGHYTNLALQEFLRTQKNWRGELCYGTGFALDGVFGSGTVLAWQEYLRTKGFYGSGLRLDGDFGYYTKLAAQEWLRTEKNLAGGLCYGKGYKLDGVWGEGSVLALQECLRAKGFYN